MKRIQETMAKAGYQTQSGNKWEDLPRNGIIFNLWMKIANRMLAAYYKQMYFNKKREENDE